VFIHCVRLRSGAAAKCDTHAHTYTHTHTHTHTQNKRQTAMSAFRRGKRKKKKEKKSKPTETTTTTTPLSPAEIQTIGEGLRLDALRFMDGDSGAELWRTSDKEWDGVKVFQEGADGMWVCLSDERERERECVYLCV
jgi:hypothetical protein